MKRANATLFAAFFHFDIWFMVWALLGPLALFIAKDLNLSITQKAFVSYLALAFGSATAPPLAIGQILVFAAVGSLGAGKGAVFQIVPQRFGKGSGS